jgi:hypothetical protein
MIPFQNSLIERIILCFTHKFLNCCHRSNSLTVEFVRTFLKSLLEDLSFQKFINFGLCLLVLKI